MHGQLHGNLFLSHLKSLVTFLHFRICNSGSHLHSRWKVGGGGGGEKEEAKRDVKQLVLWVWTAFIHVPLQFFILIGYAYVIT